MGENARFENGHARVETRVLKSLGCRNKMWEASVSIGRQRVGAFYTRLRVEELPLNIRIQWNAGTACVSECVPKMLACRGLRVGPSKKDYIHKCLFSELASWKITLQLHRMFYWNSFPQKLHYTHSFVIQRITWENCLGIIFLENRLSIT